MQFARPTGLFGTAVHLPSGHLKPREDLLGGLSGAQPTATFQDRKQDGRFQSRKLKAENSFKRTFMAINSSSATFTRFFVPEPKVDDFWS